MVIIPAGVFRMGDLVNGGDDELPVLEVQIRKPFAMSQYEVTVGQFRQFVVVTGYLTEAEKNAERGCYTLELGTRGEFDWTVSRSWLNLEYVTEDNQPVVCVSWDDAQAYVEWLSEQTGKVYRLPSEAEWEYAARAGSETRYHFGDEISRLCDYGNVLDTTALAFSHNWPYMAGCHDGVMYPAKVGSYRPNGFGLYDMHGNVREWVEDCWGESYRDAPDDGSPWIDDKCEYNVQRGGSWSSQPRHVQTSYRHRDRKAGASINTGIRLVRDVPTLGIQKLSKGGKKLTLTKEEVVRVQVEKSRFVDSKTDQKTGQKLILRQPGEIFSDDLSVGGKGPELVVIPAGTFHMGDLAGVGDEHEWWVHQVQIQKPFAMSRYELTVGQYRLFVAETGYRTRAERETGEGCKTLEIMTRNSWRSTPQRNWRNLEYALEEDQPVVCVTRNDAQVYAHWLSEQTGQMYRLPSEAEWEYAARAGSVTLYHFGDDPERLCNYGNMKDLTELPNGYGIWSGDRAECHDDAVYPTTVGKYRPNAFGLHDMHGNVREWVADCSSYNYKFAPVDGTALYSRQCEYKNARGSSWNDGTHAARSAKRHYPEVYFAVSRGNLVTGIRLVRDLSVAANGSASLKARDLTSIDSEMVPRQPGDVFTDELDIGGQGPELVVLPKGSFIMGKGAPKDDSEPAHSVQLRYPFAMSRYEVTIGQFRQFVGASRYQTQAEKAEHEGCLTAELTAGLIPYWTSSRSWQNLEYELEKDQPVVCVSWNDAQVYAAWLSEQTGVTYRLPSESEWEYAARSGSKFIYPRGELQRFCGYGNYGKSPDVRAGREWIEKVECDDGAVFPTAVGSYQPNVFGLYDMLGNVAEWVQDCTSGNASVTWNVYDLDYYGVPLDGSAHEGGCGTRIQRGGGWRSSLSDIKPINRKWHNAAARSDDVGIRLVRELPVREDTNASVDRVSTLFTVPEMVVIPAGVFRMGDLSGEGKDDERPVREVRIPKAFALSKYEVTVGQYRQFVEKTGYRKNAQLYLEFEDDGCHSWVGSNKFLTIPGRHWKNTEYELEEDQPVVCVNWSDAQAYVAWLSEQTGASYRLPSEAEWEYAARAGNESLYHFGDEATRLCEYGNVADMTVLPDGNVWPERVECNDGAAFPTSVGSYRPNAFGLYDMHGNVWEWVQDCRNYSYEGAPSDGSAWMSGNCYGRMIRGGSWMDSSEDLRSAARFSEAHPNSRSDLGFPPGSGLVA